MDKINNKEQLEMWESFTNMIHEINKSNEIIKKTIPATIVGMDKLNINDCNWDAISGIFQKAKKRKDLKIKINETLREFNAEEMGGGYLYFIYDNELIQLDLDDYTTSIVCKLENIKDIEYVVDLEGILIVKNNNTDDNTIWINENGFQLQ